MEELVAAADVPASRLGTLAGTLNNLGLYASRGGDVIQAKALLGRACELWERAGLEAPSEPWPRAGVGSSYVNLANLLAQTGEADQAQQLYEKAAALFDRLDGQHPWTQLFAAGLSLAYLQLAQVHNLQGRVALPSQGKGTPPAKAARSPIRTAQNRARVARSPARVAQNPAKAELNPARVVHNPARRVRSPVRKRATRRANGMRPPNPSPPNRAPMPAPASRWTI